VDVDIRGLLINRLFKLI